MNVVAGNGIVHQPNSTGKYTICRTLIRSHWNMTQEPIDCPACLGGRRPRVKAAPNAYGINPATADMLAQLDCVITDELFVVQVLPDVSGAVVTVRKAELQTWCERRLEARKTFANKCIRGGSGAPVLGKLKVS